ncbi:hypothetical protein LTS18_011227 [Coniosporium uncinatum]|uniref:Uncharacterized protein n=1 Tax=Coniosporium uncinatum TaxID=93489 RepID=A0ACC3DWB9_9PEZI|nr:hypothetical protein LTS18_011227 [Coniosporium uncinatum]
MFATRTAFRSTGAIRSSVPRNAVVRNSRNVRFQSTQGSSSSESSFHPALTGAIGGGVAALGVGYLWYHFSGARTIVKAQSQAQQYFDQTKAKFKDSAPEPNEAIQWLRRTADQYAAFIPGGSHYVNSAFDDLESIRKKHGQEVDKIVRDAYNELRDIVTKKQMSVSTAQEAWDVLQEKLKQIFELAGDAAEDIINNHPQLKEQVGGNIDMLKSMGEKYGPEAKKQVDQTWEQISDVLKTGVSTESVSKIRKIVQDKSELIKKIGDEIWSKGMETAKPYLDKSPQVKEMIEKNADALKRGNFGELYNKIKEAVDTGSMESLEKYVKQATNKANTSSFGGLSKYLDQIPSGSEILPKLSQMQEIAQKHGKEAESLFKETINELSKVVSSKADKAKQIADNATQEGKSS